MPAHKVLEDRTVAEVMTTDLLAIDADESIIMAWELMCRARVHHLPVIGHGNRFLGVLDARTLTANWDATPPQRARRSLQSLLPRLPLETVGPDDSIHHAASTMLGTGTDHVAVADEDGSLIGLLTAYDLISALAGVTMIHEPGGERRSTPSLYRIEPVLPDHPGRRETL